mgnify:CR=1 FL=1
MTDPIIFPPRHKPGCRYMRCIDCGKEFNVDRNQGPYFSCPDCDAMWRKYRRKEKRA